MSKLSQARRRTARMNGARLSGPVTPVAQARSSPSAIRHGVLNPQTHLRDDEKALAEGIHHGYARRFRPQDHFEIAVIENLVILQIKLRRLDRLELEAMDRALMAGDMNEPEAQKKYPSLATLGRYRSSLHRERATAEARLELFVAQRPDVEASPEAAPGGLASQSDAANDDRDMNEPTWPSLPDRGQGFRDAVHP